jgi:hypothetical protein
MTIENTEMRSSDNSTIARSKGRIIKANDAMDSYKLLRDALTMIDIPDRVYGAPNSASALNLLGLAKYKGNLRSSLRLLHLEKSIVANQEAMKSNVKLLDDGMSDARPRTDETRKITERNAMISPLLNLLPEVRNRIFAFAMGGY